MRSAQAVAQSDSYPGRGLPSAAAPAAPLAFLNSRAAISPMSAPEQREQDDDGEGKSDQPQQQAATEAHDVLLWFTDLREPPQTAPGFQKALY